MSWMREAGGDLLDGLGALDEDLPLIRSNHQLPRLQPKWTRAVLLCRIPSIRVLIIAVEDISIPSICTDTRLS